MADKIFTNRLNHTAEALSEFYGKFIYGKPSESLSPKVILNYKNLLALCVGQGIQIKKFSIDQWWSAQKTFPPKLLKVTKPLVFLELKMKKFIQEKNLKEAEFCLKEFKRIGHAVSVLVFKDLFGATLYFKAYNGKIYFREDVDVL